MEITIKIDAPELVVAINGLAIALSGREESRGGWTPGGGDTGIKPDTPGPAKEEAPTEAVKEEPTKTTEKPAEEPKKETAPTGLTFEQVRVKLAEVSQAGKQKELKELITSFGAARLSDIPEEKFAELLEKASDL